MNKSILIFILAFSTNLLIAQALKTVEEAKGLQVGIMAPDFEAIDANNSTFKLNEALKIGPVVLIFYRGFWCPVCNKHLSSLQDSLSLLEEQGAQVIAISPEKPEYLNKMSEKTGASYTLLYDEAYKIATAYDVNYKPTSMQTMSYNIALNANMKKSHTDKSQNLPIPATFIIDKDGRITWRQFDPNYKNRASVKDILEALE